MHVFTILQGQASDVLHNVPKQRHMRKLLEQLRTGLGTRNSP
jgi:hypothetical protein